MCNLAIILYRKDYHTGEMMQFSMGHRSKKRVRLRAGAVPSVHTAPSLGPGQPVFFLSCCVFIRLWKTEVWRYEVEWRTAVIKHLYWTAASTPNGDADVMEAKWISMVSRECDLNLCLPLPAYAAVWERNTAGHHRLHENTARSCLPLHLLLFSDPSRGSTRSGCWCLSSTLFTI